MKKIIAALLVLCLLGGMCAAAAEAAFPDEALPQLKTHIVDFVPGKRCAVYSGPGSNYYRGGGGKALVSTNDTIWAYGEEDGWVMIRYDISSRQSRVGWISEDYLDDYAAPLNFAYQPAVMLERAVMTDDPYTSRNTLILLTEGTQVDVLAVLGEWLYVEHLGRPDVRGFVPADSVDLSDVDFSYGTDDSMG